MGVFDVTRRVVFSSCQKRATPIISRDCQLLGFGLVRNDDKTRDFLVIYYYPVNNA